MTSSSPSIIFVKSVMAVRYHRHNSRNFCKPYIKFWLHFENLEKPKTKNGIGDLTFSDDLHQNIVLHTPGKCRLLCQVNILDVQYVLSVLSKTITLI